MTDEERRLYLAAATRLEQVTADPEASVSDLCHIASRAAFEMPHGRARIALEWFIVLWQRSHFLLDSTAVAWLLQASALKLRAQAEEAT